MRTGGATAPGQPAYPYANLSPELLQAAGISGPNISLPQTTPDNPTPPASGAAPAASNASEAPVGPQVHTNADGSAFYVGPDKKPVPLEDGLVLRTKKSGQLLVWVGGKWQPNNQRGK